RFSPATLEGVPVAARVRFRFDIPPAPAESPDAGLPPRAAAPRQAFPSKASPTAPAQAAEEPPAPTEASESLETPPPQFGASASVAQPPREVTRRTLASKDIQRVAGVQGDPLRAIEILPGVGRPALNEGVVLVRGSSPDDTVIMLEGTPVVLLYHLGGFKSFFGAGLLDRVDFYPGNFSARYGRAIGGAVDARVRDPRRDGPHAFVDISLLDASAAVEGPIGERWSVAIGARRSYVDAFFDALVDEDDNFGAAPVYWDYQAIVQYNPGPGDRLRLLGFGSSDRLALLFDEPDDGNPDVRGSANSLTQFHRALLSWDHRYEGGARHRLLFGLGYLRLNQRFGALVDQRIASPDFNGRAEVHVPLGTDLVLEAGLDFSGYSGQVEYTGPRISRSELYNSVDVPPTVTLDRHVDMLRPALYGQLTWQLLEQLQLIPGFRLDYYGEIEAAVVDPRLTVRAPVLPGTVLKAGVGSFSQPPPLGAALPELGNPDLKPTRSIHTSLGVEQQMGEHLQLGAEVFWKRLYRLVVNTEGESVPLDNGGEGRVAGMELSARLDGRHSFGVLSYTLSRSERRENDREYIVSDFDQTHVLALAGGYNLGAGFELSATFRLVSGRPLTPIEGSLYNFDDDDHLPLYGAHNSGRAALFHRLDVKLLKRWTIGSGSLSAYVDVQNVYNARHAEDVRYSFDHRSRTEVKGLPILPVLGLRGEL
ncbi:MAG: TonB-dependent receptor, partial [Myxococcales bacterium]|nr:TonB-dependent receptor [Myxococcales bacterium]